MSQGSVRLAAVVILLLGLARGSFAADSLAAVAPADTALFLEVPAPDATWQAFEDSELAARWKLTRLSDAWLRSRFVERWRALDGYSSTKTGQPLTQHLRRLFSDGVAIAVVLRDGEPKGVLIARAASAEHVAAAVQAWDKLEPPLRTETRRHAGRAYLVRVVKKGSKEQSIFYATDETRFLLSDQEQLVRDCLERWRTASGEGHSLADQSEFRELTPQDPSAAFVFVSPRYWQAVLKQLDDGTPGAQMVLAGIGKLRGVMGKLRLDRGLTAEVTATLNPESLSTDWRDFAAKASQSPTIVNAAPADALVVVGGRLDTQPIIAGFIALMSEHDRNEFQKLGSVLRTLLLEVDPWTTALPTLLSDWGGYIAVRPPAEQTPSRSHPFVAVLSSRRPAENVERGFSDGLENALSFGINALATALTVAKNGPPVVLKRHRDSHVEDWSLTGRPWGEFAVRLSPKAVWCSSSVAELRRASEPQSDLKPTPLSHAAKDLFPNAAAFFWVNTRRFRMTEALPALRQLAPGEESPPLVTLDEISKVFDQVFGAVQIRESQIEFRAGGRVLAEP